METDSDGLLRNAVLYIGEEENKYLIGERRRRVIHRFYNPPVVHSDNKEELLKDGQVFYIGDIKIGCFMVLGHIWGHIWGHTVYLIDDEYLFIGDTIWFEPDGGRSFINTPAEDNRVAIRSLAARELHPKIITSHTLETVIILA